MDFIPLCVQTLLWFAKADLRWHSTSVSIFCPFSTEWVILFLKKFWRNSSFFFFFGDFEPTRTSNVKSKQTLCFPNISILNYIIFILNGLIFCSIFVYYLFKINRIRWLLDDVVTKYSCYLGYSIWIAKSKGTIDFYITLLKKYIRLVIHVWNWEYWIF